MQLSIIIVNYNVKCFLEQCLYSVIKAGSDIDMEVFVVDNNSTDDSRQFFSDKFSSVKFIWNNKNVGFAKANNQALELCTGKYILFLNPDTILPEDCFTKCIRFIESKTDIGALGIKMIDGAGHFLKESKRGFPSPVTSFYKFSGLAAFFPRSKIFARYYAGHLSENENHEVDVLAGAFMMIPKTVLNTAGSFDEDFFMYGEDIDLSYRIQKSGFKNYYLAESAIIHFKGESTSKLSLQYVRYFYSAMYLFVKKHYGFIKASTFYLFIQLAICIKILLLGIIKIVSRNVDSTSRRNNEKKTLIVSDEETYNKIVVLLKQAYPQLRISARVGTDLSNQIKSIGTLSMLPKLVKKYSITEIIFCNNEHSFKDIIHSIQQYSFLNINYMFHAAGSNNIVGSNNKNSSGVFIED